MNRVISTTIISAAVAVLLLWTGSNDLYAQGRKQAGSGPNPEMHRPPSVDQVFAKDDKNGDGQISKDEFGGPAEHFSLFDADGDGFLTREEVTVSLNNPPRPRGQGRHPGAPPQHPEHPEEQFTQSDTDGDGVLSAEEFTGPPDHFSLIDTNEDGVLTKEELADARNRKPAAGSAAPPRQAEGNTGQ